MGEQFAEEMEGGPSESDSEGTLGSGGEREGASILQRSKRECSGRPSFSGEIFLPISHSVPSAMLKKRWNGQPDDFEDWDRLFLSGPPLATIPCKYHSFNGMK